MTNRFWSKRSRRAMAGIHPDLRAVLDRALVTSPLDFIVIEGVRSKERQRQLVAEGASQTMNSRHLTGHAVDLLPIGADGPAFAWPLYDKLGPAVKKAAADLNIALEWGGDWTSFRDGPHFQLARADYPESKWTTGQAAPKRVDPVRVPDTEPVKDAAKAGAATAGGGLVIAETVKVGLEQAAPHLPEEIGTYLTLAAIVLGVAVVVWRVLR
jgi:peptidoglycan L-alanyl-D-glutamate endopeptidase CwlK